MASNDSDEKEMALQETENEYLMCPFVKPGVQRVGNMLVASMCMILPLLILMLLLSFLM